MKEATAPVMPGEKKKLILKDPLDVAE